MPKLLLVTLIELGIAFVYIWMAWVLITLPIYNLPNWVGPLFSCSAATWPSYYACFSLASDLTPREPDKMTLSANS